MAGIIINTGDTKSLRITFKDSSGAPIAPPQQMTFTCADTAILLGTPSAKDVVPVTAGSSVKAGIAITVSAPGINNGVGVVTVDVASNQQTSPVTGAQPTAAAMDATLT
jgi:hypothetical protein